MLNHVVRELTKPPICLGGIAFRNVKDLHIQCLHALLNPCWNKPQIDFLVLHGAARKLTNRYEKRCEMHFYNAWEHIVWEIDETL